MANISDNNHNIFDWDYENINSVSYVDNACKLFWLNSEDHSHIFKITHDINNNDEMVIIGKEIYDAIDQSETGFFRNNI